MSTRRGRLRGVSLIELIVFIVIIMVGLMGILGVMNQVSARSADPLIRKQALAIAESLLEEVELMPFTYCDPNDPSAVSATTTADCTLSQDVTTGPVPASETRTSTTDPFDNVTDYAGYTINEVTDPAGNVYAGYSASVAVARAGSALTLPENDAAVRITVTVTGPDNTPVVLDGYRTRYTPNAIP